jgi:HEAT repeat protein
MNCEKGKELLAGWMEDQLTEAGRAEMEAHLAGCAQCRQQVEANRRLWVSMGDVPVPQPSGKMQVRFDAMLDTYKQEEMSRVPGVLFYLRQLFAVRPGFTWAYSVILVVVGVGFGYLLNRGVGGAPAAGGAAPAGLVGSGAVVSVSAPGGDSAPMAGSEKQQLQVLSAQIHEMREMVLLSLLENPSASERIRGVSYTSEISKVNRNVINALLSTLNNDPNSNVRLITLEALTHYADDPVVREGLVQSILQQDSPLVQAALADAMLKLQEKKAVPSLKELLHQKDLNEMVRMKIRQTLTRLI